ncbi:MULTISPECIES: DUF6311 domain-containing protein [Pseudomonas]|uniref:DUF6311 domain-containing protein n=1 Tax=Pseudomonas aphyarum TaxID=2942629 RepID=A0ABT5PS93_9PSED|nr:DUF6311 domain-containing protein [Pseudomonas aphyarum]MDD0967459.1 DUF6311 domain-containing protein [Pseudomonas aphyarum]MDD1126635.1 DUF6311 domain-containing protein [Pseudomonas aphyarum]
MKDSAKRLVVTLLPLMIGVLAFFIVVGPRALNPQNIAWLGQGDPATHYLGWVFFRQSPWTFPLGLNPTYGLELGNGLIFSDSNPLLALLFKPFTGLLPETFQYFGLWFLGCFMLQSWFAWKLLGLITPHVTLRALGAALFLFAPPMIMRIPVHLSLAGHFVILAALYLALRPGDERRRLAWGALLGCTALIHAYLLAMVALIWLADLAARCFKRKLTVRKATVELVVLFALVSLCCWQAGYFSVSGADAASDGFGLYRANILTLFSANAWSYTLKDIPNGLGDSEGFGYLGLGLLLLAICGFVGGLQGQTGVGARLRRYHFLLLAMAGLTVFAVSNNIALGPLNFSYPLPEKVLAIANIFRASGRMFWPVYYAIILLIIFLVIRANQTRAAVCLLALALVIQVSDTRSGWSVVRKRLMVEPSAQWASPFVDPFWKSAAAHYPKIRWILPQNYSPQWLDIAAFAANHGLSTDAVYLGRMSSEQRVRADQHTSEMFASGQYDADSLYLLSDRALLQAVQTADTRTDLLTEIDGFTLLAPGWKQCRECLQLPAEKAPQQLITELAAGQTTPFGFGAAGNVFLAQGWSVPEPWGVWSSGPNAELVMRIPDSARRLRLETTAFLAPSHVRQGVVVRLNGLEALTASLDKADGNTLEVSLTPAIRQRIKADGLLRLQLQFADAISPQQLGMGQDPRKLAMGLKTLTVN